MPQVTITYAQAQALQRGESITIEPPATETYIAVSPTSGAVYRITDARIKPGDDVPTGSITCVIDHAGTICNRQPMTGKFASGNGHYYIILKIGD